MIPVLLLAPHRAELPLQALHPPVEHPCRHFKEKGNQSESAWCSLLCQLSGNGFASQEEICYAKARIFRQGPSALPLLPSKSSSGGLCVYPRVLC